MIRRTLFASPSNKPLAHDARLLLEADLVVKGLEFLEALFGVEGKRVAQLIVAERAIVQGLAIAFGERVAAVHAAAIKDAVLDAEDVTGLVGDDLERAAQELGRARLAVAVERVNGDAVAQAGKAEDKGELAAVEIGGRDADVGEGVVRDVAGHAVEDVGGVVLLAPVYVGRLGQLGRGEDGDLAGEEDAGELGHLLEHGRALLIHPAEGLEVDRVVPVGLEVAGDADVLVVGAAGLGEDREPLAGLWLVELWPVGAGILRVNDCLALVGGEPCASAAWRFSGTEEQDSAESEGCDKDRRAHVEPSHITPPGRRAAVGR